MTLMQWQWQWHSIVNTQDCLFLHMHQQMFCLNYVHIVKIGFRLEMCTCWVLTRVCFILATSHHYWSAQIIIDYFGLAFADTRRVEGHLFWGNIWLLRRPRRKDYLRQLEKLHGVGLAWQYIASQSNRLLLCICQDCVMSPFEKKKIIQNETWS